MPKDFSIENIKLFYQIYILKEIQKIQPNLINFINLNIYYRLVISLFLIYFLFFINTNEILFLSFNILVDKSLFEKSYLINCNKY